MLYVSCQCIPSGCNLLLNWLQSQSVPSLSGVLYVIVKEYCNYLLFPLYILAINLALKIVNQYQDTDDGPTCIYQDYCIKLKYICWFEVLLAHFVSDQSTIPGILSSL